MHVKLEIVPLPVADLDRSKTFSVEEVGFELDHDVEHAPGVRVVQVRPPGSSCSIQLRSGLHDAGPVHAGSVHGRHLVVESVDVARSDLMSRGVRVSPIDSVGGGVHRARFTDPDGSSLVLQEMAWRTGEHF